MADAGEASMGIPSPLKGGGFVRGLQCPHLPCRTVKMVIDSALALIPQQPQRPQRAGKTAPNEPVSFPLQVSLLVSLLVLPTVCNEGVGEVPIQIDRQY